MNDTDNPDFNVADHISDDGYNDPDTGDQVYIGFPWGSASLSQTIPLNGGTQYLYWVDRFFYYALNYDMSVNYALEHASYKAWGNWHFDESPLRTGFTAYWWNVGEDDNCTMAVYGNGNIHLGD
ncbi:MAG: hypothetical protein ACOC6H_03050 [Thermoproteota archaeon]